MVHLFHIPFQLECGAAWGIDDARCNLGAAVGAARAARTIICPRCLSLWHARTGTSPRQLPRQTPPAPAGDDARDARDAAILGVSPTVTRPDLRRALRAALRATHPDRGGDAAAFRACADAAARMRRRRGW